MSGDGSSPSVRRAEAALDMGRFQEALTLAHDALAADPQDVEALVLAARALGKLGDRKQQAETARAVVRLDPDNYNGHLFLGSALLGLRRREDSIAELRRATSISPDLWNAYAVLAVALSEKRSGREEAWAVAQHAVALAPDEALTHYFAGRVAFARKDYPTAEACFRASLNLDPTNAEAHNALSVVVAAQGRRREAAHGFVSTLALDPQSQEARDNLDGLTVLTIARLHMTLFIGVLVALGATAAGGAGRIVAIVVALIAVGVAERTVRRNHAGMPSGVTSLLLSFPRRDPVRALWGLCCAAALLGLVVSIVIPNERYAVIPIGVGWVALWAGWALSWLGLIVDKVRGR